MTFMNLNGMLFAFNFCRISKTLFEIRSLKINSLIEHCNQFLLYLRHEVEAKKLEFINKVEKLVDKTEQLNDLLLKIS